MFCAFGSNNPNLVEFCFDQWILESRGKDFQAQNHRWPKHWTVRVQNAKLQHRTEIWERLNGTAYTHIAIYMPRKLTWMQRCMLIQEFVCVSKVDGSTVEGNTMYNFRVMHLLVSCKSVAINLSTVPIWLETKVYNWYGHSNKYEWVSICATLWLGYWAWLLRRSHSTINIHKNMVLNSWWILCVKCHCFRN